MTADSVALYLVVYIILFCLTAYNFRYKYSLRNTPIAPVNTPADAADLAVQSNLADGAV